MLRMRTKGSGVRPLLLAAAVLACSRAAQAAVTLSGHIPPQIRSASVIGDIPSTETVHLSLVVRLDQALLNQTLARIYSGGATARRSYLSSAEFAQTFDLADKRRKLEEFAQAAGLALQGADQPDSLVVKVAGPAGSVERAFAVKLHRYRGAGGQIFRANNGEPSIPSSLAPHLLAVVGLSDFRGAKKPHLRRRSRPRVEQPRSGSCPGDQICGSADIYNYGLWPSDIKTIYNVSNTLNGSGQTMALYELDGYNPSDITMYEESVGFPTPYPNPTVTCTGDACGECGMNQNQSCDASTLQNDSGMEEVALDIEMGIAMAPGANFLVYTAFDTNSDSLNAYADIANDDIAKTISTSWGEDEEDLGASAMASENEIFAQMAAQGQTIFAAAGDAGAYDASGVSGDSRQVQDSLLTDDPASQPYVTGAGGTNLTGTIGALTEVVWNEGCESNNNPGTNCGGPDGGAGGGGVANYAGYWAIPSFQSGVTTTYSKQYRNVPDVSLYADPDSFGYNICVGGACRCPGTNDCILGGTSVAAPLWAGLATLNNQQRAALGEGTLGFANPSLYAVAQGSQYATAFHDIVPVSAGDCNNGGGDCDTNGYYSDGTGYDDATGWGSFHGDALMYALDAPPSIAAASPEFTGVTDSAITVNWSTAGQYPGSIYTAQISSDGFSSVLTSSATTGAAATFTGLAPATEYAFRIDASTGIVTTAFNSLGQTYTLAAPPTALSVVQVGVSTITLQWSANGNPAGIQYSVSYWQAVGSTLSATTTLTEPTLSNLAEGATYFLTVGAINGLGALTPSGLVVSTVTVAQPMLTGNVTAAGGTVSIHPPPGLISLSVPPGAVSQPVAITLSMADSFPPSASAAAELAGTGFGVQLTPSPDVEPLTNTQITFSYQAFNTAGLDPSRFSIARYDDTQDVWVPLACSVNTRQQTVTGLTSHWSLFQLMTAAPATSLSAPDVYPDPFRPALGETSVTFSNLPADATIRIYDILGEKVRQLNANASGLASWDGRNENGNAAASGVYFVLAGSGNGRKVFKVAIQR